MQKISILRSNYYKDKIDDVDDNASDGESFEYKIKIVGNTLERLVKEENANRQPVPTLNDYSTEIF